MLTDLETLNQISALGQESIHVLTILATHLEKLGRDTDAELISGAARDVAGVVLCTLDQMIPDQAVGQ